MIMADAVQLHAGIWPITHSISVFEWNRYFSGSSFHDIVWRDPPSHHTLLPFIYSFLLKNIFLLIFKEEGRGKEGWQHQ